MKRLDMAKIGPSSGTKCEVMLASWYRGMHLVRVNDARVKGRPDLTFRIARRKFAIFADGRFWHDPKYAATKQRDHHEMDWVEKAKRNRRRDRRVDRELSSDGWIVIHVWDDCFMGKARSERTRLRLNQIILRAKPGDRWSVSRDRTRRRST